MKKLVMRAMLAFVLALIGGALVQPMEASAETMLWKVKSNYKYKVQLAFYSQTRNHEWPGGGDAYNVNDYDTHEFNISCNDGEKICLGGWVTGNAKKYWGVGYNNRHGCKKCCYICGGGPLPRQVLD